MYIKCNQKFMFCKDRGIDFSVWLCRNTRDMGAQHFWDFLLYCPLDGKKSLSNASTTVENQTFDAGETNLPARVVP